MKVVSNDLGEYTSEDLIDWISLGLILALWNLKDDHSNTWTIGWD
jgi:hypothetical protein